MTGTAFSAILLLIVGTLLEVPVAIILATVILFVEAVRAIWARYGLRRVSYRRHLERDRVGWGDTIPLTIEIWNRKPLPLAWLRADDATSPRTVVRERELAVDKVGDHVLRNIWTLAPYERVTRRFSVGGERRGVYQLGPVRLSVGDLFAREAVSGQRDQVDRFLVRPRVIPAGALQRRDRWGGTERALAGFAEDPSRFAGVREYAPGDPLRRVHPRASSRLGRPVVKVFEPSRDREVLLVVDLDRGHGPAWHPSTDSDEAEALIVVAASLARSLARERAAFGLAAAGYHGAESRFATAPISEAPGQLERVLDLMARLSTQPSAPFERLLGRLVRTTRPGTTLLVITARDPSPFLAHLRRLEQAGARIIVVGCGAHGAAHVDRARRAGLAGRTARLDGPWQTADHVAVLA